MTDVGFGSTNDLMMKQMAKAGADVYAYVLGFRSTNASAFIPEWMGEYKLRTNTTESIEWVSECKSRV